MSGNAINNALIEVTVTYIIAQISTFNNKLMFYRQSLWESIPDSLHEFTTNFGIPAVFSLNLT